MAQSYPSQLMFELDGARSTRSFTSSISRLIEGAGKLLGNNVDDVLSAIKNAPASAFTQEAESVFKKLPSSSFAKRGEFVTTASGKDLSTWSKQFRAAGDDFDTVLRDINLDSSSFNTEPFKQLNRASFPDADIANIDSIRAGDKVTIGQPNTSSLDNLDANQIDSLAARPENDNAISSLWQKAKSAGKITLATGALIAVGVVASEFIQDAIALNSGCFVVIKTTNKASWRRVIGMTCGDNKGDQLWLDRGLPTSPHPLAAYLPENPCTGVTGCSSYCEPANFDEALAAHIDEIPAEQTLVCRSATISDVLSDVASDLGTSLGNIVGGVTGGIVGGIANGLGIKTSILWVVLGVVLLAIVGIAILKVVKK